MAVDVTSSVNDTNQQTLDEQAQFNADYAQLQADSATYADGVNESNLAATQYQTKLDSLDAYAGSSSYDPFVLFMMFIYLFCDEGSTMMDTNLAVEADKMTVSADVTNCTNDMQSLVGSDNSDPQSVTLLAAETNTMMGVFDPANADPNSPTYNSTSANVQSALGQSTSQSLYGNLTTIRSQIYTGGQVPNDPTSGYYFDSSTNPQMQTDPTTGEEEPVYITSFAMLQTELATPGDTYHQNEAAQNLTNAFNQMTSTTQSWGAAENIYITNDTNNIKAFQAFISDMMSEILDPTKMAVQNQGKA